MKDIFQGILRTIGLEWAIKQVLVSALLALREVIVKSSNTWDDRIGLAVIDGMIAQLQGKGPLSVEAAYRQPLKVAQASHQRAAAPIYWPEEPGHRRV